MKTVTDLFEKYIGTKEYNGIIATIQKWFYGEMMRDAWCATSMSYFMHELGILKQIGGKNENVYCMMEASRKSGYGKFYYARQIPENMLVKRGTIIFNLNSGTKMTEGSSKHVTSAYEDFTYSGTGHYQGLGGNQSDMIKVTRYTQGKIYAIFVPEYEDEKRHSVLKKGSKGDEVKELQKDLNSLGYADDNGNKLEVDGSFGALTEQAVKNFQKAHNLVTDGHCGSKTWAAIDAALDGGERKVKVKTTLNCRTGAGVSFPVKTVLQRGEIFTCTNEKGKWIYLEEPKGYVNRDFVTFI